MTLYTVDPSLAPSGVKIPEEFIVARYFLEGDDYDHAHIVTYPETGPEFEALRWLIDQPYGVTEIMREHWSKLCADVEAGLLYDAEAGLFEESC